jgi:hypothetical protein
MTPDDFRKLAMALPETQERSHMKHPDFRVAGKIFATLGYPNKEHGMVKLTPVEQEMLVREEPKVFTPVTGAWGRKGATSVLLKAAKKTSMRGALAAAWRLAAPKQLAMEFPDGSRAATSKAGSTKQAKRRAGKSARKR